MYVLATRYPHRPLVSATSIRKLQEYLERHTINPEFASTLMLATSAKSIVGVKGVVIVEECDAEGVSHIMRTELSIHYSRGGDQYAVERSESFVVYNVEHIV